MSIILKNTPITVNASPLTNAAMRITLEVTNANEETTTFGSDGWVAREYGLRDWKATVEGQMDFGAGGPYAVLWPLLQTKITFTTKPTSATTAGTNPLFTGTAVIDSFNPLDGEVGKAARFTLSLSGAGPLTPATS